jgi:transcription termination factor Rho
MDIKRSGTRKEELLLTEGELNRIWILRRVMDPMGTSESIEWLLERIRETKNNKELLEGMSGIV